MSTPRDSSRPNEPVEGMAPQHQLDPVSGPDGDAGDQDIDTAGTEHDEQSASAMGPTSRRAGRAGTPDASFADAPDNERKPIGAHNPASMHRREDDDEAMAHSPDFHDAASGVGRPVIDRHR
jgi:hypothetical protein